MAKEAVQGHFYEMVITAVIAVVVALFVANFLLPRGANMAPVSVKEIESMTGRVVPSEAAYNMYQLGEDIVFVDIREQEEFIEAHIPGAIWIPHSKLREKDPDAWKELEEVAARSSSVMLYCGGGHRSGWLATKAREFGLSNVYNLYGLKYWAGRLQTVEGGKNNDTTARLIHVDEAYFYYTNYTDVIFVDARKIDVVDGKIKGAVILNDNTAKLKCNDEHVFYCDGSEGAEEKSNGVCKSAVDAVRTLVVEKGCSISKQKYIIEGYQAWKDKGYPVEKIQTV